MFSLLFHQIRMLGQWPTGVRHWHTKAHLSSGMRCPRQQHLLTLWVTTAVQIARKSFGGREWRMGQAYSRLLHRSPSFVSCVNPQTFFFTCFISLLWKRPYAFNEQSRNFTFTVKRDDACNEHKSTSLRVQNWRRRGTCHIIYWRDRPLTKHLCLTRWKWELMYLHLNPPCIRPF